MPLRYVHGVRLFCRTMILKGHKHEQKNLAIWQKVI